MSENNIPTPEATPAPVTVATKAPKSKGLSMYNRIALVLLLVLIAATTTLFTLAVQKTKAERDIQAEIQTVKEQVDALAAPAWCEQVTPDNVDKIDELYSKYYRMSPEAQESVKKACKERVDAVELLKFQDAEDAFKVESTCELDDAQTTLHCTADVSPASDTIKTKLEAFPTTDLTFQIWFDDTQFVVGTPDHVTENVATATMTKGEKVSLEFTTPYDASWGSRYNLEVTKYFPHE
ncbi:MAG: hypothetical protein E7C13_06760 [Actinomyces sp.]|nr:hypothetical protein [Actinomyces sp.]